MNDIPDAIPDAIPVHTHTGHIQKFEAKNLRFANTGKPKLVTDSNYVLAEWDDKDKRWVKLQLLVRYP